MSDVITVLQVLLALTIFADVVLYLRLRQQGLDRIYRTFAWYLLFRAVRSILLMALPPLWYGLRHEPYQAFSNNFYAYSWGVTVPLLLFLQVLIVLELYSLVLENYRGLASMGRWVIYAGLAIAIAVSSLAVPAELSRSTHYPILRLYNTLIRGVDASLVIFLLSITAFLVWFPIPLNRNVILYSVGYAITFTLGAIVELADNLMSGNLWTLVSLTNQGVSLVCLGIWIALLNRAGEQKNLVVRQGWTPESQERLMHQLAAINTSLLRSARG